MKIQKFLLRTRGGSLSGCRIFNEIQKENINSSNHICLDELMGAWQPQTTKTGNLPNITFILRKPEALGTEFKCASCTVTGCMLNIELQHGREGMKTANHNAHFGAIAGCTLRLTEEW